MISGLIAGLYLNSLIKEKSQNLEDQLPVAKKCARLVTSVVFVVLYIIVIGIVVFILVRVIGLEEGQTIDNENRSLIISVMIWLITFSIMIWHFYWKPCLLSCCGLAIKSDFIYPNIRPTAELNQNLAKKQQVDLTHKDSEENGSDEDD